MIIFLNSFMKSICVLTLLIVLGLSSSIKEQKGLAVTIYNNNFAMVKDVRSINFAKGSSSLYFTDVSSNIQTQTVTFKPLDKTSTIQVYEQNFQNNLINKQGLLKRFIQKEIRLYVKLGDQSKVVKGTLLGYDSGYIVQTHTGLGVFNTIQAIEFPELPEGFFTVPTLNWKVYSQTQVTTDCEVAYRTTGFAWKADYSITLSDDEKLADIGGWVTIDNNSGKKYVEAKLKLIAGDVNVVTTGGYSPVPPAYPMIAMSKVSNSAATFAQKSFADYHMYTLSQPVTLNQSSQKQVEFIPKVYNVAVRKYHLISINVGGSTIKNIKAQNKVEFRNSKEVGLGIPLPKGTVRVFKSDKDDGSLEFVGQDSIDHTPKDQNLTITTGNAFDLTTNVNSQSRETFKSGGYTAKMNMTITNHKDTPVQVQVVIANYYGNNLQLKWNTPTTELLKTSANQWKVSLKALGAGETWTASWVEDYQP